MLSKIRCTVAQKAALIEYMWDHRRLARNEYDANTAEVEWLRLAETLNQPGSVKTVDKWKTTWRDIRRYALREVRIAEENNKKAREDALKIREIVMEADDGTPKKTRNLKMSPSPSRSVLNDESCQSQEVDLNQSRESSEGRVSPGELELEAVDCTPDCSSDSSLSVSPSPRLTKIRCTLAQKMALIDYMWDHRRLARCEYDANTAEVEWLRLAETINQTGSVKTVEKWKVTWRDLKRKAFREVRIAEENHKKASKDALKIREIMRGSDNGTLNTHRNLKMSPSPWRHFLKKPSPSRSVLNEESCQSQELEETIDLDQSRESSEGRLSPSELELEAVQRTSEFSSDSCPSGSPIPTLPGLIKIRCNNEQINALVDCMAINTGMAFGYQQIPKKLADWKRLRQLLNRMGSAKRTVAWQHSWRDLKRKALERNKMSAKSHTPLTKKILDIITAYTEGRNTNDESTDGDPQLRLPPQVQRLVRLDAVKKAPSSQDGKRAAKRVTQVKHSTDIQILALVDYMEKHPALAIVKGVAIDTQCPYAAEWRKLSLRLNRIGNAKRSTIAWKRTWHDLKKAAKQEPNRHRNSHLYKRILGITERAATLQKDTETNKETVQEDLPFSADIDQVSDLLSIGRHSGRSSPAMSENGNSQKDPKLKVVKQIRCTNAQKHALVDYMSTHLALATSQFVETTGRDPHYAEWRQLSKYLNKIGIGTSKTTISWKRTWRDLKLSVLKKKWCDVTLLGIDRRILDICEKDMTDLLSGTVQEFDSLPDPTNGMPVLYLRSPDHTTEPDIVLCDPHRSQGDPANQEIQNNPNCKDTIHKSTGRQREMSLGRQSEMSLGRQSVMSLGRQREMSLGRQSEMSLGRQSEMSLGRQSVMSLGRQREMSPGRQSEMSLRRQSLEEMSLGQRSGEISPEQRSLGRASPVQGSDQESLAHSDNEKTQKRVPTRVGCTRTQVNALVNYMSRHPELAKKSCLYSPDNEQGARYQEWKRLCRHLNQIDKTVAPKSVSRWKYTWRTLELNACNKDKKRSGWSYKISRKVLQILNANDTEAKDKSVEDLTVEPTENYIQLPSPSSELASLQDPLKSEQEEDMEHKQPDRQTRTTKPRTNIRRSSNLQLRALADYMIAHPKLAVNPCKLNARTPAWVRITTHLNNIGPARSSDAWRQTWRDLKLRVSARAQQKKPGTTLQSFREKRIMKLIGLPPPTLPDSDCETVEECNTKPEPAVQLAPRAVSPRSVLYNFAEILARKSPTDRPECERRNDKQPTTEMASATNETNHILRELVQEMKRSNELKEKQNGYLKELVTQLKTPSHTHETHDPDETLADSQTDLQKHEVDTQYEGHSSEIHEDHSIDETPEEHTPFIRPVALSSLTTINTPGQQLKRVKVQSIVRPEPQKTVARRLVRLKDGTMVLLPSIMKAQVISNQDKNDDQLYVVCGNKRR